jgi:hypothetical protein
MNITLTSLCQWGLVESGIQLTTVTEAALGTAALEAPEPDDSYTCMRMLNALQALLRRSFAADAAQQGLEHPANAAVRLGQGSPAWKGRKWTGEHVKLLAMELLSLHSATCGQTYTSQAPCR